MNICLYRILCIGSLVMAMEGCATLPSSVWEAKYGSDKPQFSLIRENNNDKTGDLMIWNPNTTAAYITPKGKACIQAADVFRVKSAQAQASLAADALSSKITGVDASASSQMVQSAMLLANQDAKGTFLSVALFNLCMMNANDAIDNSEVKEIFLKSLEISANMTSGIFNSNPGRVSPGSPADEEKPGTGEEKPGADEANK